MYLIIIHKSGCSQMRKCREIQDSFCTVDTLLPWNKPKLLELLWAEVKRLNKQQEYYLWCTRRPQRLSFSPIAGQPNTNVTQAYFWATTTTKTHIQTCCRYSQHVLFIFPHFPIWINAQSCNLLSLPTPLTHTHTYTHTHIHTHTHTHHTHMHTQPHHFKTDTVKTDTKDTAHGSMWMIFATTP